LECFVIIKCRKFGQLILRKIIIIVPTRCRILRLKCTKFYFGWGSAPDPARELTALPQTSLLDVRGLLLRRGRGGEVKGEGGKGIGNGKGREGKGEGRGKRSPCSDFKI